MKPLSPRAAQIPNRSPRDAATDTKSRFLAPQMTRRTILQVLAAQSALLPGAGLAAARHATAPAAPRYLTKDAKIEIHCTDGYPSRWKQIYQNTLDHFSKKWGRVGPVHVFLIENADWKAEKTNDVDPPRLIASQKKLKRMFCELLGRDSDGAHLDWSTGNHWTSWSIRPANLMITMTMSPYRDPEQFVVGPLHEYLHAIQTVYGYADEAIDGNRMGHSLWTGPAWWREWSAVLVAAYYSFLHEDLFNQLKQPFSWRRLSREMNRNLEFFQMARTPLRIGVTHDDWQRLEQKKLVHPVVYAGGSVACALLLRKVGSLDNFMKFFPLVPALGWRKAFEKHFRTNLAEFYNEFEKQAGSAKVQYNPKSRSDDWFGFLKSIG